jgi:hypothetical protein
MKRLVAIALLVAGSALPVCAQHHSAAAHGGFAGHSGPAFHGGFSRGTSAPAPNRLAAPPRYSQGFTRQGPAHRAGYGGARPAYRGDGHRRPYISPYRFGVPYAGGPWIWPGYPTVLDYNDDADGSQGYDTGAYDNGGYDTQGPYDPQGPEGQPPPSWPALGPYAPAAPQAATAASPAAEEAVTLVFKDGRPAEQIHNYVLTSTTLYVGDGHRREIPLDQLDLTATAKVNRDAGVDFRLPQSLN